MTSAELPYLYAGVLFFCGLAIGSFLNVVIYRVPAGLSLLKPPSSCPKCKKEIFARDNLPVLGWLLLGGKCRFCRARISIRYPLNELATGLLWAAVGWRLAGVQYGFWQNIGLGLAGLGFVSALLVTFWVDWDWRIILDEISLGGCGLSLAAAALPALHHAARPDDFSGHYPVLSRLCSGYPPWAESLAAALLGLAVGLGFSLLIYFLGGIAFRKQIAAAQKEDPDIESALGWGDVKLMAFFGAFLGWYGVLFIFVAGSLLGAAVGGFLKFRSGDAGGKSGLAGWLERWRSGNSVLAFGPFLALAALAYYFYGESFKMFMNRLSGW